MVALRISAPVIGSRPRKESAVVCRAVQQAKLKTETSEKLFKEACEVIPGGVNSPVRAFKSVGGQPLLVDRVEGAKLYDVDGNEFVDYVGSWGPAIVGHSNPVVREALEKQLFKGTSYGAPCQLETELAERVVDAVPSVEMVRMVSSGTEACMSALRVMRAATGRDKVIKFEGCYHGHADPFLVQAGSGVVTLGLPDSPGVTKSATGSTLTAAFNDLDAVKALFDANPGEIAGVIVEPFVGNSGFIAPGPGFLEGLRKLCSENGSVLCFDEVMTGFRVAYGGAQERTGVTPDLTTMGKVIGGGLPVGAYGGKKELMELVAPAGPMYQAGTLSGNPLAMVAGLKTLEILSEPGAYDKLEAASKTLTDAILKAAKDNGHDACGDYAGGMFGFFFSPGPVKSFADAKAADGEKFARWHRAMLERGVYLACSQFEAGFVSLAHDQEALDRTIQAAQDSMGAI